MHCKLLGIEYIVNLVHVCVCLRIVPLVMHRSFVFALADVSYVYKISDLRSLEKVSFLCLVVIFQMLYIDSFLDKIPTNDCKSLFD